MPSLGGKVKLPKTLGRRLRRNVGRMSGPAALWLGTGLVLVAGLIEADLTVLVPYVGATANVNLGVYDLTCDHVNITNETDGYQIDGLRFLSNEGIRNIWLGEFAGAGWTTGYNNIAIGYEAGKALTTGRDNILIGYRTGWKLTTGQTNLCIGSYCARELTTGDWNQFVGSFTGRDVTTGTHNVFFGYSAGMQCTTGHHNTALGTQAGQGLTTAAFNVVVGTHAAYSATNIWDDVIIGYYAGYNLTDGQCNTAVGSRAGRYLTTGDGNVFLGREADTESGSGDRHGCIAIGYQAIVTADHQVVIGGAHDWGYITDIYLGRGVTSATPDDVSIQPTGGLGDNIAGADFEIAAGRSTGNAAGGSVEFYTSPAGAPGAGLNALVLAADIDSAGKFSFYFVVDSAEGYQVDGVDRIDGNSFFRPVSSANAAAPNNSIFYSTDDTELSYKDAGGATDGLESTGVGTELERIWMGC